MAYRCNWLLAKRVVSTRVDRVARKNGPRRAPNKQRALHIPTIMFPKRPPIIASLAPFIELTRIIADRMDSMACRANIYNIVLFALMAMIFRDAISLEL